MCHTGDFQVSSSIQHSITECGRKAHYQATTTATWLESL